MNFTKERQNLCKKNYIGEKRFTCFLHPTKIGIEYVFQ